MIGYQFGYENIAIAIADFSHHHNDEYDDRNKNAIAQYIVIHDKLI